MPARPTYRQQIVADIIAKIEDGTYPPSRKLPTHIALAAFYGCSIEPVKAALDELEIRGYVEGHQGKGTFVAVDPPIKRPPRKDNPEPPAEE